MTKTKRLVALIIVLVILTGQALAVGTYSDVPEDYWGYSDIERATSLGLVQGMGGGIYGPERSLTNAEFVQMICNLFYRVDMDHYKSNYGTGAAWYIPCMEVGRQKGLLSNTDVGISYTTRGGWVESMVNAPILRYDMAMIMYNFIKQQGWTMATAAQQNSAKAHIADWANVPTKYQTAVATNFYKKLLFGVDEVGTFEGARSMTRAEGAAVILRLYGLMADELAKDIAENGHPQTSTIPPSPDYQNTGNLVDGSTPSANNVIGDLNDLEKLFPNASVWTLPTTYTSPAFGLGVGSQAFIYYLDDRIFGNLPARYTTAAELKPGDVIYFGDAGVWAIVQDIKDGTITYLTCKSNGQVNWNNKVAVSDLGSKDVLYTRYQDTSYKPGSGTGTDTGTYTPEQINNLINTLSGPYFPESGEWDLTYRYRSPKLSNNQYVVGSEAFAYYLNDYIFGREANVSRFMLNRSALNRVHVGDIIWRSESGRYGIVVSINPDTGAITYASVDNTGRISWKYTLSADELTGEDMIITRYGNGSGSEGGGGTGTSDDANGGTTHTTVPPAGTEDEAKNNLDAFQDKEYGELSLWCPTWVYRSPVLSNGKGVTGNEAFAYLISDYVFGQNAGVQSLVPSKINQLRVGDVIYFPNTRTYGVVVSVDSERGIVTYASVDDNGRVSWRSSIPFSAVSGNSIIYTRYAELPQIRTLPDGSDVTEVNVDYRLSEFARLYRDGDTWDINRAYQSPEFSSLAVHGSEAFAYYTSDYIFGESAEVGTVTVRTISDIRIGDVIRDGRTGKFMVVDGVETDLRRVSLFCIGDDGKVFWPRIRLELEYIQQNCTVYTRYPS